MLKILSLDIFFLSLLTALSFFLISFYLPAPNLQVTYPDWMIQAFRIKTLELHGITSWTHTWSNGINLWRSYQFFPHLITLGVAKLFHLEITRAMVILVIAQFIFLRIIVYIVARLLKFSPFTALTASLATFSIAYFWKAVGDYSLLFSFSFFPIMLYLWVKYLEGKLQWIYPYVAGLMFYIHPILGLTCISMWIIAKFFEGANIFSLKSLLQLFLFLLASSFFWIPIVFKESYTNSTIYLATKEFIQLTLAPFPYVGLSFILLICFFVGLGQQFFPIQKDYRWTKILFVFIFLYFGLIYTGITLSLPTFINQFQYTRGIGLLGIGIIFSILPIVEKIQKNKSLAIKGLLVAGLTILFSEGIWITSTYSPGVLQTTADPVSEFVAEKKIDTRSVRIWTPTIELSSYFGSSFSLRFPTSYMAQLESNHLPERLNQLINYRPFMSEIPLSELTRLNDYFMLSGIQYVFFDEGSSFIQTLQDKKSGYKYLGRIVTPQGIYEAFESPWIVRNAIIVNPNYEQLLSSFPTDMKFNEIADQIALDNKVKTFSAMVYDPTNYSLSVRYPSEESLTIALPAQRKSSFILVNESYDKQWQAYFKGKEQTITPAGPNFMAIHLTDTKDGGTVALYHSWPVYYYIILFLIPATFLWLIFFPKIIVKKI